MWNTFLVFLSDGLVTMITTTTTIITTTSTWTEDPVGNTVSVVTTVMSLASQTCARSLHTRWQEPHTRLCAAQHSQLDQPTSSLAPHQSWCDHRSVAFIHTASIPVYLYAAQSSRLDQPASSLVLHVKSRTTHKALHHQVLLFRPASLKSSSPSVQ